MTRFAILLCVLAFTASAVRPVQAGELIPEDVLTAMQDADVVILGENAPLCQPLCFPRVYAGSSPQGATELYQVSG